MDGFVDDTTTVGTAFACHRHLVRLAQVFLLFTSLAEGHARLASPEELSADDQGIDTTQRCCTTPHRTLGVHENPSGNYQIGYKHLVS
jgi:hypothetical protein